MTNKELIGSVAYCGLVCGVCAHASNGCIGCRSGGGCADCHQRQCCTDKGLDGCWQCESFACDKGFFAADDDPAFRGLCIGSVQCIREIGIESYVERLVSTLGGAIDYGDYRYKDPEEITAMLRGDSGT